MISNWKKICLPTSATLEDTLAAIDHAGLQIALIVESNFKLVGIVTDADIRRAILKGRTLQTPVADFMNVSPTVLPTTSSRSERVVMMRKLKIIQIPIVDDAGIVRGLSLEADELKMVPKPNAVVLMVGGEGQRLRPLTQNTPKPMLPINGRPILEIIIENLKEQGFKRFYLSVNYHAEVIESYFGSGERFDVEIRYIREPRPLGTAGSLELLPQEETEPILVMNGDILTKVDFRSLIEFHSLLESSVTVAVRDYAMKVPFGVMVTNQSEIIDILEKPTEHFQVNSGIYVVSPSALKHIDTNERLDMPGFIQRLNTLNLSNHVFPLHEYWIDVGQIDQLEKARDEWE